MSDVIIVLGRDINQKGILSADSISRVEKAVELYSQGIAPKIIMSGAYSYHIDTPPLQTEARAMREIAIAYGVPKKDIIEETESKDTLGNAYFTKKRICEPNNWYHLTVVASSEHIPRSQYLFDKVYGPAYTVEFVESKRVISDEKFKTETEHEQKSLEIAKQWLDSAQDGDDAAIWRLMAKHHPAYKDMTNQNES